MISQSSLNKGNLLVATIQLKTASSYQENLEILLSHIQRSSANLIVAPELCLTNFDYENFEEAATFYEVALEQLLKIEPHKILVLTMTKNEGDNFVNQALVIHNHQVIHRQNKYKLFTLGHEEKYFRAGQQKDIISFKREGITYALLICFELRFKMLWKQIEGADVVLIPARWGKSRKRHLEVLSQALAIMNQAFVVVSNSADEDMANASAIISPWGKVTMDDEAEVIETAIDLKEVKKVRRMISMR